MNVSELFVLTHWIDAEIVTAQIVQKYQQLHTVLQQNAQPNQQKQPFESQKDDLIQALENVALDQITKDQLAFLSELGILQGVGQEGIDSVEQILFKNVIDIATSAQKINEIFQKINQGIKKSNQIKSGLEGCIIEEDYESDDKVLLRISFSGNAAMTNVTDFKSWGNTWYEIGRGISMVHDSSPEDFEITGATKGSIVIEMAVALSIATTTSGIILAALKVADRVLDILKKAEELRGLKLKNSKLAQGLEKEAELEKEQGIGKITADIIKKLKIKKDGDGDKVTALGKAVKNLVNFIENGGEVDFVIPDEGEEDSEGDDVSKKQSYGELKTAFKEIRQLEKKIALLEQKNP